MCNLIYVVLTRGHRTEIGAFTATTNSDIEHLIISLALRKHSFDE